MAGRRTLGFGLLLVLLGSAPAAAQGEREALVTATNVQLMAEPSFSAEALMPLPQGTRVRALAVEGEWLRVLHQQRQGFVHSALVSLLDAEVGGAETEEASDAGGEDGQEEESGAVLYESFGASMAYYPESSGWAVGLRFFNGAPEGGLAPDLAIEVSNATFQGAGVLGLQEYVGLMYVFRSVSAQPFVGAGWAPSFVISAETSVMSLKTFFVKGGSVVNIPGSPIHFPTEIGMLFAPGGASAFFRTGLSVRIKRTCDRVALRMFCLKR